jgi:hypothetical protein
MARQPHSEANGKGQLEAAHSLLNAESLAYWYFRLNGFFAIPNFVVHPERGVGQRTDIDVLGVRLATSTKPILGGFSPQLPEGIRHPALARPDRPTGPFHKPSLVDRRNLQQCARVCRKAKVWAGMGSPVHWYARARRSWIAILTKPPRCSVIVQRKSDGAKKSRRRPATGDDPMPSDGPGCSYWVHR